MRGERRTSEELWEEGRVHLAAFVEVHGHAEVPAGHRSPDGYRLASFVQLARMQHKRRLLPPSRREALEALGFRFPVGVADESALGIARLAEYIATFGDDRVPSGYVTDDGFQLGRYVSTRRHRFERGLLDEDELDRLGALGVRFE